ncbi:hypothetical protein JX265_011039 [Neoarthrinium moseri]|uniref:Glucan 4-alpha-glucosidase n=1 Tax=Neoarthrinium moseri TaxID=1658444 RepID=A0A9Q0AJX8_9PEZI|nr:hypothetical protein JX265_011039 [Neoarthrinium moseri]
MTAEEDTSPGPETPRRASVAANPKTPNATHARKLSAPGGGATPKSAPAAGAGRQRSATMKQQPTLLGDFLLGRPSPARVAAEREKWKQKQKEMTVEQVKQEMREAAVRRVQAPGGVHDRVKQWQKKNATSMADADPFATPSEPSEVNIQVDEASVTEEDRVRIKKGIKAKPPPRVIVVERTKGKDDDYETEKENQGESPSASPPKKRVVSDTNWMKNKRRSPPRTRSPKTPGEAGAGSPLPKTFSPRTAPNPTVKSKIRDWADKVEIPDEPRVKRYNVSGSVGSADGIRVRPMRSGGVDSSVSSGPVSSAKSEDSEIVVESSKRRRSKPAQDDGIRVTPAKTRTGDGDGIRVQAQKSSLPDDGIRVYSGDRRASESASTVRASSRRGSARAKSAQREPSPSDRIEVFEESGSDEPNTPTRRSRGKKSSKLSSQFTQTTADTGTTMTEDVSDSESWTSGSEGADDDSDIPSSLPSKLADIPVGYSAFSELDLPTKGGSRRPKAKRNTSFKGATNVLKKAFVESKKILSERAEPPPKPVANQPRSIESWLNKTVDPFVENSTTDAPEPKEQSIEDDRADESNIRGSSSASKRKSTDEPQSELTSTSRDEDSTITKDDETEISDKHEEPEKLKESEPSTPTSAGLKRSRAVRTTSSPVKPTTKKGFKERLKDAFRGESSMTYSGGLDDIRHNDEYEDERRERRRSSGSPPNPPAQDDESITSSEQSRSMPAATYPRRRPPPTKGVHELSTIMSLESFSATESDLSSVLSDTTITQTTALTGSTGSGLSRHRSNKPGLKRRLTKHSDLVSVLSLPDEKAKVGRSSSLKSARSVRRTSNHLDTATVDGLLKEFAQDEDLYQRELKTLVDGVIPVLLNQFVHGNGSVVSEDLFSSPSAKGKEDSIAKAVVQMGIALEKLRNAHKRCPLRDAHRLPQWLESTHSIYNNYLDVWRLGFNDLIVNLAPLNLDENDSLVNALPRNEDGDIVNEDGERVDVAHLLKRPLVRVKWITRFIRGYRTVSSTDQYRDLAANWEKLQEKARRRHKEESARVVDEDAINTDTTRVRDLKTLEPLDNVRIDRFRQVYAKDPFSLDLRHSNGQRLDCQVELVSRDNQLFKSDPGDLLIRETGSSGRSWLLFPPILGGQYSARKGDEDGQLIVMIRGKHDEWYQLLTLTTDNDEQVQDWIEILGTSPEPPTLSKPDPTELQSLAIQPRLNREEAPLGERKRRSPSSAVQSPIRADSSPEVHTRTPSRHHHQRTTSGPATPTSTSAIISPERTPTQDSYARPKSRSGSETLSPARDEGRSRPLREHMRPDPLSFQDSTQETQTEDDNGPPPPPAHRTLPSKNSPSLSPPADLRVKRRTSSPLKHEYRPSDISSADSTSSSGSDEDDDSASDSSDDELEAADIPDTMPAISIKKSDEQETPTDSVISDSTVSLTPSASASQAGVPKVRGQQPAYAFKSIAAISYWDNKRGCWKDLWPDTCSIVTTPGLIEAYPMRGAHGSHGVSHDEDRPLIALDLTPLVMLRNSTVLDLEIRSPVLSYARLYSKVTKIETCFFRFRAPSFLECEQLYMAVHRARMDNAKFKALEEEARIRNFGQHQAPEQDGDASSRRRSWFGRKNSYRASTRAPSQSAGSTSHASSVSASSFLKKLMGGGNQTFDIAMSSVDRQYRGGSAEASLYTSSSSSGTPPRSPSVSAANSGNTAKMSLTTNNLKIRLHLMVSASKWEDHGNCLLEITRPPSGTRQNLRKYQGMEKRVVVAQKPKKSADGDKMTIKLDVVLGSRCFSRLGSRGILLNVWEEVRDENGEMGVAPQGGASSGNVSKWCFQCASVSEASWIFGLVTQEVVIG